MFFPSSKLILCNTPLATSKKSSGRVTFLSFSFLQLMLLGPKLTPCTSINVGIPGMKTDCFEWQVEYSTNDVDQRWELLAFGGNVMLSTSSNSQITQ